MQSCRDLADKYLDIYDDIQGTFNLMYASTKLIRGKFVLDEVGAKMSTNLLATATSNIESLANPRLKPVLDKAQELRGYIDRRVAPTDIREPFLFMMQNIRENMVEAIIDCAYQEK